MFPVSDAKRSNNSLNNKESKNIYKIPIKLIINGLSRAPLCIWTTATSAGKGYMALHQQFVYYF